jgi:hypothetical protein
MVVRYHREVRQQCTVAGGAIDSPATTSAVCALNRGLSPSTVYQFARATSMSTTAMSLTSDGLASLLGLRGPLWYGGMNNGYCGATTGGHAVVIAGVSGNELYINDPWPPGVGRYVFMEHNTFFQELRAVGNVPFLHF